MAESGSATDMRHMAPSRRNSPNLSGGWVVMLLSGLIAAVLFLFATQQSSNKVAVIALNRNVQSGQPVDQSFFTRTEVSASDTQLKKFIRFEDRNKFNNWIAGGPLESGDVVPRSLLREPAQGNQQRSMSIPIDKTHAVNGNLRAGDRIDVINADAPEDEAYTARNVEVLSVDNGDSGGLAAQASFSVNVAVSEDQAVKISKTIRGGKFDLIRSTGATSSGTSSSSSSSSSSAANNSSFNSSSNTTTTTSARDE